MRRKTFISWSSGKDSAWALNLLQKDPTIEIAGLFCTVNQQFNRVAMHGVRVELLQQQAASIGIPLYLIWIPYPCSDEQYAEIMNKFVIQAKQLGVEYFAFGDIFLENVRKYREERMSGSGIKLLFPNWGIPTVELAHAMINSGLRAVITCLDPQQLEPKFAGRDYDAFFCAELPSNVDVCGENGEFHTFVYDGPMFLNPIKITTGATVLRDNFYFTDILPG